jgi:protein subunit release factor B
MRSSGPGGQSVNTTNSKAQVKLLINQCSTIDSYIK